MTRRDKGVPRGARWGSWEWDAAGGWQLQGPSRERKAEGIGGFERDLHENPLLILPRRSINLSLSAPHPSRCCLHPPAPCSMEMQQLRGKALQETGGAQPSPTKPWPHKFPPPKGCSSPAQERSLQAPAPPHERAGQAHAAALQGPNAATLG